MGTKISAGEVWLGRSAGAWGRYGWDGPARCGLGLRRAPVAALLHFFTETLSMEANSVGGFNDVKTSLLRFVVLFADHEAPIRR